MKRAWVVGQNARTPVRKVSSDTHPAWQRDRTALAETTCQAALLGNLSDSVTSRALADMAHRPSRQDEALGAFGALSETSANDDCNISITTNIVSRREEEAALR